MPTFSEIQDRILRIIHDRNSVNVAGRYWHGYCHRCNFDWVLLASKTKAMFCPECGAFEIVYKESFQLFSTFKNILIQEQGKLYIVTMTTAQVTSEDGSESTISGSVISEVQYR